MKHFILKRDSKIEQTGFCVAFKQNIPSPKLKMLILAAIACFCGQFSNTGTSQLDGISTAQMHIGNSIRILFMNYSLSDISCFALKTKHESPLFLGSKPWPKVCFKNLSIAPRAYLVNTVMLMTLDNELFMKQF